MCLSYCQNNRHPRLKNEHLQPTSYLVLVADYIYTERQIKIEKIQPRAPHTCVLRKVIRPQERPLSTVAACIALCCCCLVGYWLCIGYLLAIAGLLLWLIYRRGLFDLFLIILLIYYIVDNMIYIFILLWNISKPAKASNIKIFCFCKILL